MINRITSELFFDLVDYTLDNIEYKNKECNYYKKLGG